MQSKTKIKTNKPSPLVSVVMPVYNAEKFLSEAIRSILNQTYRNFELIIVDDLSTDSSSKIIKRFESQYPNKIRVFSMKENLNCGGDKCANFGILKAKGKYIARMDADDISDKTRLQKQVDFLEKNKKVSIVGSNAFVINGNGKVIGEKKEPLTPTDIYKSYFTFHPLIHPTCMMRRKILGKKFTYKIAYDANNDYLTFFTLICQGTIFVNLEEKLLFYRIHGNNDTFINMRKKFINTIRIRFSMVKDHQYTPSVKDVLMNIIQAVIVLSMPERVLKQVYFWAKGITDVKITISLPSFKMFRI